MERVDCIVIGAGVVGLAVAARLSQQGFEVMVLEQHELIGSETSSRNSEVIHAGIYYPSGSLKAWACVTGKGLLYQHCEQYSVPFQRCGKVIVATADAQESVVRGYMSQASRNGVKDLEWLSQDQLHALEPNVVGVGAALSPSTGVVDSHSYMVSLQGIVEAHGGFIALNSEVRSIQSGAECWVHTDEMDLAADWVINCAGLHAPGLAGDITGGPNAHYAKGHYYSYSGPQPFSRLVYPTAEAAGLGVHVTLDLAGQVKFGPDVQWIDGIDYAFDESNRDDFVNAIRAYFPDLQPHRLQPSYTGIRPKISGPGEAAADFMIRGPRDHGVSGRIDLLGIESPGLTSSLALAELVVGQVRDGADLGQIKVGQP